MNKQSIVNSGKLSLILRAVLWISILVLIILMFYVYHEGAWRDVFAYYRFFFDFKKLRIFIASFGPYAAPIFILVQSLQVVFAPVPGEVTGFVGGFLFGNVSGVILSTVGLTIGSLTAFGIARTFGIKFVEKIVKKHYIDKFNFFVTHKGLYITFIFFLIPGFPKDSLCYLLGLTRMRIIDFILMNVFGRLPGTLMLTLQGSAVKDGKYQAFFTLLIISIILTFGLYLARNHIIRAFIFIVHPVIKYFQKLKR
ncbi:MAG TPA: TVP38/TMEM64 family protein [Syntrophorhabdaceae bacterium]|nr:TVP38/TMEM64 family protein [Syntrophorhabdaceae bacterium]